MTCEIFHQIFDSISPYTLPIVSIYIVSIFQLYDYREQTKIKFPVEKIRPWFRCWCFCLALYSLVALVGLTFPAFSLLRERAWISPVSDFDWRQQTNCCFWVTTFFISKFVELGDTFFILCLNRPLLLLQWFHHMTTLLYVQDALIRKRFSSFWFIYMNLFVHSLMYSYYVTPILAPYIITFLQVVQMVGGLVIIYADRKSGFDLYGFTMYALYLYLFTSYFLKRYIYKNKTT